MSRSRSDMPAGWTATPAYHPEFGVLSPYASKRSGIPMPVLLIAGGIAVSATIGFASEHWSDGETRTITTVEQIQAPAAKAPQLCTAATSDNSEASFLSAICGPGKLHAKHGGHARFSTVVLGRTVPRTERVAEAPIPSATSDASAKVENERSERTSVTPAPERVAAVKKPKAKSRTLAAQARELERQNAFNAFASERGPGLAYAPRPISPRWGYSTPFGPSW